MENGSVILDTFTIERTYPERAAHVFAAFASLEAKSIWGDTGGFESVAGEAEEFDFRPGGHERFVIRVGDTDYRYDAQYYDIVPDARIVYAYEMYANGRRISVSLATIEFLETHGTTILRLHEQGAYLDGIDGAEAPSLRREGTAEMLDGLATYLATSE